MTAQINPSHLCRDAYDRLKLDLLLLVEQMSLMEEEEKTFVAQTIGRFNSEGRNVLVYPAESIKITTLRRKYHG